MASDLDHVPGIQAARTNHGEYEAIEPGRPNKQHVLAKYRNKKYYHQFKSAYLPRMHDNRDDPPDDTRNRHHNHHTIPEPQYNKYLLVDNVQCHHTKCIVLLN